MTITYNVNRSKEAGLIKYALQGYTISDDPDFWAVWGWNYGIKEIQQTGKPILVFEPGWWGKKIAHHYPSNSWVMRWNGIGNGGFYPTPTWDAEIPYDIIEPTGENLGFFQQVPKDGALRGNVVAPPRGAIIKPHPRLTPWGGAASRRKVTVKQFALANKINRFEAYSSRALIDAALLGLQIEAYDPRAAITENTEEQLYRLAQTQFSYSKLPFGTEYAIKHGFEKAKELAGNGIYDEVL